MNDESRRPARLHSALAALLHDLPALAAGLLDLLSLELERARAVAARIAVLTALALVMALTAWLASWSAIVQALIGLDWPAPLPWLLVVVANAAGLAWAWYRLRRLAREFGVPASYRQLRACVGADAPRAVEDAPPGSAGSAR